MPDDQIYQGAITIAGTLALEIPDNEAVINRSLALAKGIYEKLNIKTPEPFARAEPVEAIEPQPETEAIAHQKIIAKSVEHTPPEPPQTGNSNYLDEVFLS